MGFNSAFKGLTQKELLLGRSKSQIHLARCVIALTEGRTVRCGNGPRL